MDALKNLEGGESIPYSEDRIRAFADEMLQGCIKFVKEKSDHPSYAFFLPGQRGKDGAENLGEVKIKGAFDSPDAHSNCLGFLRQYAEDTKAHAVVLVAMRDDIAYPQIWRQKEWEMGMVRGLFVQLDSALVRKMWWVPTPKSSKVPLEPIPLDPTVFSIAPRIFRDMNAGM